MMAVGRRIRELRTQKGMSLREVAHPAFSHAYLAQIEAEKRQPSARALEHIAAQLEVEVAELASGRPAGIDSELELALQDARIAASSGHLDAAEKTYRRVLRSSRSNQLRRVQAKATEGLALCQERRGDLEAATEGYEAAESLLADVSPSLQTDPLVARSRCFHMQGDVRHAIYILETHLQRLSDQGLADPATFMKLHAALISPYMDAGLYDKAGSSALAAMELEPHVAEPDRLAMMYVNVARVYHSQSKYEQAGEMLIRAEDLFAQARLQGEAGIAHLARGYVLGSEERLDEALEEFAKAQQIFNKTRNPIDRARVLNEIGHILRQQGKTDEAIVSLELVPELLQGRHVGEAAFAHRELGVCYSSSDPARAEKHLRKALELYDLGEDRVQSAITHGYLGELLLELNRQEAALDLFRTGIKRLPERI